MRRSIFVILALLTACTTPAPEAQKVRSLSEIEGAWDILVFDGHRPARLDSDGQRRAFVNISGEGLSYAIECNFSGMAGRIDDSGRLIALPGDSVQTTAGCGRERNRRDEVFFGFFRTEPTVSRRGADGLVLRRGGRVLELQRSDARQRALWATSLDEINGAWRADIIYHEPEQGYSIKLIAGLNGAPAEIAIADGVLRMRFDCETVEAALRMTAPGAARAETPRRTTAGECALSQQDRDRAASLVSGAFSVERMPPEALHLVAGDVRAVLRKAGAE